ncbi:MAG: hypothetical protein GY746_02560 [Gammaproteobacteria bacterium]|nr:hypothetical protein [Gammaproteobacteria bacterium]
MEILGAGLSRTGTKSLTRALEILGFTTIHNDRKRLNSVIFGIDNTPDFRVYDDVDAVTDLPSAYFFRELLRAYPTAKAILTVRDTHSWLRSYRHHTRPQKLRRLSGVHVRIGNALGLKKQVQQWEIYRYKIAMRNLVYGSVYFREYLHQEKYERHNASVIQEISEKRLLIMNVIDGDGWEKLCPFLGVGIPCVDFPSVK